MLYFDTFFSLATKPEKINVGDSSSSTKLFLDEISQKEIAVGKVEDIVKPSTPAFKCWIWSHGCTLPWLQGLLNKLYEPTFPSTKYKEEIAKTIHTGVQGWCSGESTHLPAMWPGFDSQIRLHMWVEFVGSLLCTERFPPGTPVSPLLNSQHLT